MSELAVLDEPVTVTPPLLEQVAVGMTEQGAASRLARLRGALEQAEVDALLVSNLANVRYLTGFSGSAGLLVVHREGTVLVTDGRYRVQVAEQVAAAGVSGEVEVVVAGAQEQRGAVAQALAAAPGCRVGLEAEHVTWAAQRRWAETLADAELVPTSGVVEALRQVKDAGELWTMARAAAVADAALAEVVHLVAPGRTEQEVALALDSAMRRLGADDRAFETIVASGPSSAKPHARPTARRIERGDAVVVDFGATVDGYRSDMTRTFLVGEASAEMRAVWGLVCRAQAAGVTAVGPGVATGDVDAACRQVIADAGYGEAFEHGTGHGVGLDVHEAPSVSAGSAAILAPGIVVTVEPGVYVAGLGGVRIEDTVVVTSGGCRTLTRFPKEPVLSRT